MYVKCRWPKLWEASTDPFKAHELAQNMQYSTDDLTVFATDLVNLAEWFKAQKQYDEALLYTQRAKQMFPGDEEINTLEKELLLKGAKRKEKTGMEKEIEDVKSQAVIQSMMSKAQSDMSSFGANQQIPVNPFPMPSGKTKLSLDEYAQLTIMMQLAQSGPDPTIDTQRVFQKFFFI